MPAFCELRQFRHLRGITLRHALLDPVGDARDLLVRQTALVSELAVAMSGVPGRHVAGFRNRDDQRAALLDVFIRDERERSCLAWTMARHAIVIHDGSDVFA